MSSTIAVTGLSVSGGFVGSGLPGGILAAPALPPLMVRKRGLFGFAAAALLVALADLSARGIFPVLKFSRLIRRQPTMFHATAIRSAGKLFIFWFMQVTAGTHRFSACHQCGTQ